MGGGTGIGAEVDTVLWQPQIKATAPSSMRIPNRPINVEEHLSRH